jgi:hypothetical protein
MIAAHDIRDGADLSPNVELSMIAKILTSVVVLLLLASAAGEAQSPYEGGGGNQATAARAPDSGYRLPSRPWAELTSPIVIASSFSGGISLGSYQSGVNWGLTQFLKLVRANPAYRKSHHLPELSLVSMSGASAGNINAVLSAIEYCDSTLRAPEASLFWKAWITTGWPQLFPADRSGDEEQGLFDRRHFQDYIEYEVRAALSRGTFVPGCRIPIGLVVTRLVPGQIPLDTTISLPAQRFVGMFEARVVHDSIKFTTPQDRLLRDRSLGARLSLYHDSRLFLDPKTVFGIVEASSSYPVAFSAKQLTYLDPDCQLYPPPHRPCSEWITADFIDGGVFDNNPVGLAYKMFQLRDETDFPWPASYRKRSLIPRLLYVDPSAYRGTLAELGRGEKKNAMPAGSGGFTSVMQLITGFIPSARTYELQSFARAVAVASPPPAIITATTRAHPVVGEHLNAFAAFLGRPFREFDFNVGVSDAIHYIAMEILCDPARVAVESPPIDSADADANRRECFLRQYHDLLENRLVISSESQRIIGVIANRTDADLNFAPVPKSGDRGLVFHENVPLVPKTVSEIALRDSLLKSQRLAVAFQLEAATARMMLKRAPPCEPADLITEILCADRFGELLQEFTTPVVRRILEEWVKVCKARRDIPVRDCPADQDLLDLIHDPDAMLRNTFLSILSRLRAVEADRKTLGSRNYKLGVKSMELAYRSTDGTARRGLDLDPSSIGSEESWLQLIGFLPYYAGGGLGVPSFEFGWQPTVHLGSRLAFVVPVEFSHFKDGTAQREYHWYNAFSPGAALKFNSLLVSQLQVNLRFTTKVDGLPWSSQGHGTFEGGGLLFAGKIRLTGFVMPPRLAGDRTFRWAGTIAVADTNGLLYWVLR